MYKRKTTGQAAEEFAELGLNVQHGRHTDLWYDRGIGIQLDRAERPLRPHEEAAIDHAVRTWLDSLWGVLRTTAVLLVIFGTILIMGGYGNDLLRLLGLA